MSLLFNRASLSTAAESVGRSLRGAPMGAVATPETAMRHSGVWACLRVRADLISTTPFDVYRRVGDVLVEVPKPPVLTAPAGDRIEIEEWFYSSQMDLDRFGNAFGIITQRDGAGRPARIDLVPATDVVVVVKDGNLDHYRIAGEEVAPESVWHEKQFTSPGVAIGMSPVALAAWSLGTYLSAQQFALDWFGSSAAPTGHLRNTVLPKVDSADAQVAKERFKEAVRDRDILVTGRDWEFNFQSVPANTMMFLEEMKFGIGDSSRFFGVPGDIIDAETSSGSITYANVNQRNLQLLILNMGPAFYRREKAISRKLLAAPREMKFTTDATVMRMDPESRSRKLIAEVAGRLITPTEARELDNRQPFTDADLAEFDRIFGKPRTEQPGTKTGAAA